MSGKTLLHLLEFSTVTGKKEVKSGISIRLKILKQFSFSLTLGKYATWFGNDHCHTEGVYLLLRLILPEEEPESTT